MFAALPTEITSIQIESLLLPILLQLVVIIAAAQVFGSVARKLGQPRAMGEVLAGLCLGPSLFQWLAPGAFAAVFQPTFGLSGGAAELTFLNDKFFALLAQLGLIFLLFQIGLEFDFTHLKLHRGATFTIAGVGLLVPFALGAALGPLLQPHLEPHPTQGVVPVFGLTLFLGVSMAITAIPMLGRILMELGIQRTRLGAVVIAAAAAEDAVGWILLATVAALAKAGTGQFDWTGTGLMISGTLGFTFAMFRLVRPLLSRYLRTSMRRSGGVLGTRGFAVVLLAMLLCAVATNLLGIFAIFGAFLLGAVLSDQLELREQLRGKLQDFIAVFFLPIFFTTTGLRTDIGTLNDRAWLAVVVVLVAVLGKLGGCTLAAKWSGYTWRESAIVGAMMNTRGLMELVVINLGRELGIVPPSLYCALVIMAVLTTMMTTPLVLLLRRGTELEEPIRASGFLAPGSR